MSGDLDPVSLEVGKLTGTVDGLVKSQSALFRKAEETDTKIDALTTAFTAFSQQDPDTRGRLTSLEIFRTRQEEDLKHRTKQRNILLAAVPAVGVAINQIIEFFKGLRLP